MTTPVLYDHVDSTNAIKIRFLLAELGEEIELREVPLDDAERRSRMDALVAALDAYDTLLDAEGPYALGAFTIADCALAGRGKHLSKLGLPDGTAPRVLRSVAAAQARPAFARALDCCGTYKPRVW